ncbi:hypothetical protein HA402_012932 [Bradysia odoriphaga]|nr:hypothetical protein HA402_012932 [Bradysia odoriphaga]
MLSDPGRYSVYIAVIFALLSTTSGQTQCSNTGIYFEEVAKSCTNYTRCVFGLRSEHSCDEGFQFDPTTSRCDLESIVGCNKCPENIGFGDFSAYADTDNCSMYQECGKTCDSLKMRRYPEVGDVTCTTTNIPGFGSLQAVQQYCCP